MNASVNSNGFAIVLQKLRKLPAEIDAAGERALKAGLLYAVGVVQRDFLQGPRPLRLGEITARLRNSITSRTERGEKGVIGHMGTNVKYGAFHEYGFRGIQSVRSHVRVTKQFNGAGNAVDTRSPVYDPKGKLVGFKQSRKASSGKLKSGGVGIAFVKAHNRNVNYKGRPFIRPGLTKSMPVIMRHLGDELSKI